MTITDTSLYAAPTSVDDVILDEVGPEQWRALNRRVPSDQVAALLGFVSHTSGRYEITLMAKPATTTECANLDAVLSAFTVASPSRSQERARHPQPNAPTTPARRKAVAALQRMPHEQLLARVDQVLNHRQL